MLNGTGPAFTGKRPIEDYEIGLGETLGTAAVSAFDNSLISDLVRAGRNVDLTAHMAASVGNPEDAQAVRRRVVEKAGGTIEAVPARKRVSEAGVEMDVPDAGMPQADFDTLLALRKRQKRDAVQLSRRPKTAAGFAAETVGSLAGFAVDPINVAAAFIPLVGQARYAAWLERAGSGFFARAGVRAGAGAIEGAAGTALLEPFNLALNRTYEPQYGLADSFLNIAFGTVFGGGLHVMGGGVFDAFTGRARRQAARAPEPVARAALADAVTAADAGRRVNVAPLFDWRRDVGEPTEDAAFVQRELGRALEVAEWDVERALGDIAAVRAGATQRPLDLVEAIKAMGGIRIVDAQGRVTSEGGDVRAIFDKRYPPGLVNNKTGIPVDGVRERLQEEGWLRPWDGEGENPTSTNDVLDLLGQWKSGKKPRHLADETEDLTPVKDEIKAAGIAKADTDEVAAFKLAQHRAQRAYAEHIAADLGDPAVMPDTYDPSTGFEPRDVAATRMEADEALKLGDDGAELDEQIEALGEVLTMASARAQPRYKVVSAEPKGDKPHPFLDAASVSYKGEKLEPDRRVYVVEGPDGPSGYVDVQIMGNGVLRVNDIVANPFSGSSSNSLGPAAMRGILRQLGDRIPGTKKITGERVSGARMGGEHFFEGSGKEVSIDLPEQKGPDLSGLSEQERAVLALADEFDARAQRSAASYRAAAACIAGVA